MGWERKRGKLHELNRLLRGATDTSFLPDGLRGARPASATSSRSTPTRGCRGARSSGWSARWRIRSTGRGSTRDSGASSRATRVLQPRVTPPLPGREGSLFQRLSSGPAGIDPYAAAVSDVYQDLFGEGSYTGKGIYDVDAFEAALAGRVPENALLSHDLFEGIFARAGLVTDIELFESAPSHYGVAAARQHRGRAATGSCCRGSSGERGSRVIGRWKMLDNLRRTLSAPAAFLTLVVGVDAAGHVARGLERLRPRHHRRARAPAGARRRDPAPARHLQAQPRRARSAATSCWPPRRSGSRSRCWRTRPG